MEQTFKKRFVIVTCIDDSLMVHRDTPHAYTLLVVEDLERRLPETDDFVRSFQDDHDFPGMALHERTFPRNFAAVASHSSGGKKNAFMSMRNFLRNKTYFSCF